MLSLRLTEIFYSLQGEARYVGAPTVFIRLTGCPLRCVYCDSEYAFHGGQQWSLDSILDKVAAYQTTYVCVTGGEPLAQPNCLPLLTLLCDKGYRVSLETSGAMDVAHVDERVSIVMDLKGPSSGELNKNRLENIALLKSKDQIKFVIGDRADYDWAAFKMDEYQLDSVVGDIWLSPSYQQQDTAELAGWMLEDRLPARLQIQLHKLIWGDVPGV